LGVIRNILKGCSSYGNPEHHQSRREQRDGHRRPGAIANQCLTAAPGLGLEKEDCAVLFHLLAKLSGVPA